MKPFLALLLCLATAPGVALEGAAASCEITPDVTV
jgi:hypothetical protein